MKTIVPALCAIFALAVPAVGSAQRAPSPAGVASQPPRLDEREPDRYRFRNEETVAIRDYYKAHPPQPAPVKKKLPPGLKKKVARGGELPPGWQKKVARGEVMDPVVYQRSRPLPPALVKTLPPSPRGTVVVTVDGKVVRLLEATLTILDVFDLLN